MVINGNKQTIMHLVLLQNSSYLHTQITIQLQYVYT